MKAPAFWAKQGKGSLLSIALSPLSCLYAGAGKVRQMLSTSHKLEIPVICIGNLVAGGTGKTPVALSLGHYLKSLDKNVHYLSRGYGGNLNGPIEVDIENHSAVEVGDEPLLLARIAPTWIAKNRVEGAKAAVEAGAEIIIMDDGFQNPHLEKTLSVVVVDAAVGFGNGAVIPAGPLRETISSGMARADAAILIGDGEVPVELKGFPVHRASLCAVNSDALKGKNYIAFAGIGRPGKFFSSLEKENIDILETYEFADHYSYTENDIQMLKQKAKLVDAKLITTEKDLARLSPELRKGIEAFPVVLYWDNKESPSSLLTKALING